MDWRRIARQEIARCRAEHNPQTVAEFKRLVSGYYPFGERAHWPYKIWLDEVRRASHAVEHTPTPEHVRNYWTR